MTYKIYELSDYEEWYSEQTLKSKTQIDDRLDKIREYGHFGHINDSLGDDLSELKFNDGRRIYYIIIPVKKVVLLLGGNKNGQNKDITKAKNIIKKARERIKD